MYARLRSLCAALSMAAVLMGCASRDSSEQAARLGLGDRARVPLEATVVDASPTGAVLARTSDGTPLLLPGDFPIQVGDETVEAGQLTAGSALRTSVPLAGSRVAALTPEVAVLETVHGLVSVPTSSLRDRVQVRTGDGRLVEANLPHVPGDVALGPQVVLAPWNRFSGQAIVLGPYGQDQRVALGAVGKELFLMRLERPELAGVPSLHPMFLARDGRSVEAQPWTPDALPGVVRLEETELVGDILDLAPGGVLMQVGSQPVLVSDRLRFVVAEREVEKALLAPGITARVLIPQGRVRVLGAADGILTVESPAIGLFQIPASLISEEAMANTRVDVPGDEGWGPLASVLAGSAVLASPEEIETAEGGVAGRGVVVGADEEGLVMLALRQGGPRLLRLRQAVGTDVAPGEALVFAATDDGVLVHPWGGLEAAVRDLEIRRR